MKQQIHLAAMVLREGRLLLIRPQANAAWQLPGGPFPENEEDMDGAMDALLSAMGINVPAIEEDFIETLFLREGDGQIVYNLYSPTEWTGEPKASTGGLSWFGLDELELLEMDARVRNGVLRAFGLQATHGDTDRDILSAFGQPIEASRDLDAEMVAPVHFSSSNRREHGLAVLRTLRAGAPGAEDELRRSYPELADDIIGALGDTWARPELDRTTRSLQVVAMLAALGHEAALRSHIEGALNHGATPEQIIETLRMVAVYAGFPAALAAWPVMEQVFAGRGIERGRHE
ncbi:MAG: carboxymuconolactone decarboxylase family protein [Tepidiformaceae bacterium]